MSTDRETPSDAQDRQLTECLILVCSCDISIPQHKIIHI